MAISSIAQSPNHQIAKLLLFCLLLTPTLVQAAPAWWDAAWPYRVQLDCPAGEGDVAQATVILAGRTTDDARDLRLVDDAGRLQPFEAIYHDPQLSTLLAFRVPADKAVTYWLYFGNTQASKIDTSQIDLAPYQQALEAWKEADAQRQEVLQKRQPMEQRRAQLQQRVQTAEEALGLIKKNGAANAAPVVQPEELRAVEENLPIWRQEIAQIDKDLAAIAVPAAQPQPQQPSPWRPQRGVILRVYRKGKHGHPKSLLDLADAIAQGQLEGAAFRQGVADGFNPFGESDHYISVYEGYLRIDKPGNYAFSSCSDDGSWIVVKGQGILAWPGPHSWGGSERGQKNGRIELPQGLAHITYYQEEGSDNQLAFLAWKPPGEPRFQPIPFNQWAGVRQAKDVNYEGKDKPLLAVPRVKIASTYWIKDTEEEQATLVELADASSSKVGKIVKRQWSFGDGLTGSGENVRHVFFRLGRPTIELTVTNDKGQSDTVACAARIFKVDVVASYFNYGQPAEYAKAAAGYDAAKMAQDDLRRYTEFWRKLEKWREHLATAEVFLQRFPDDADVADLAASAAEAAMQPQAYNPRRAEQLLATAVWKASKPVVRHELLLRRAQVLAWDLGEVDPAQPLYQQVLDAAGNADRPKMKELTAGALIGLGDLALLRQQFDQARARYEEAATLAPRKIEEPEEQAKLGSYPYTIDDLLARGEFEWALKTLDQWETEFPDQKLEGLTLFLRGKVLFVQQPTPRALRYLEVSQWVNPRGIHIPEAVWLHANCLLALNRYSEAIAGFQRIQRDFTESEFFARTPEKITECQKHLKK